MDGKAKNIFPGGFDFMKKEYDFSKAEQGKFNRSLSELEIPVYLNKEVKAFFGKKASERNLQLEKVINTILKKEMNLMQKIG
jgi:hypothetical protein